MSLLARRNRPMHMGPYPMENIKRVDRPTTLIIEDEIKRVPKRADGFTRADHGDFGGAQKAARDMRADGHEPPHSAALMRTLKHMVPLQNGEPVADKAPVPDDLQKRSNHFKSFSYFLNASQTGICEAKDYMWYSHNDDGSPITPREKYAIVMLIDQGQETLDAASGDDWISSSQSMRAYMRGGEIGAVIAQYIWQLGYRATVQTAVKGEVMHLPLILWAGLGELSRIGEVVINPFLGPRFKSTVITTDMPLAFDKPIDFGIQDFCQKCLKCARECPVSAIPYGPKIMYNGYETWKPDIPNCTSYRVSNPKGLGCGRCLKMCPWNKADRRLYDFGRWMAIRWPWSRRILVWLDDQLCFGVRNPVKKWWWDLKTTADGKVVVPDQVNERDINPKKPVPDVHRLALYNADMLPPADEKGAWPFSREEGLKLAAEAESPAQAHVRLERAGTKSRDA